MTVSAGPPPAGTARAMLLRIVLSVAVLLPMTVLFGLVWQSADEQTDFADSEHQGLQYLSALLPVEIALIDAQTAAVSGQPVPRENLNRVIAAAAATNARLGGKLRTEERWAEVRAKIEALPDLRSASADDVFKAYTETTDLLLALIEKVRTTSNLVRDPDPDTFYLQDGAAQELPEGIAAAGQLADLAVIMAGKPPAVQADAVGDLLSLRSGLASNASDLADGVRLAVDATGSRTLGANLLTRLDRFRKVIDVLIPSTSLLQGRTVAVDIAQVTRTRTEVQTAAADLSQAMLREIGLLIDSRVADVRGRLRLAGGTAVLGLLVVLAMVGLELVARRRPRVAAGSAPVASPDRADDASAPPPHPPDAIPGRGRGTRRPTSPRSGRRRRTSHSSRTGSGSVLLGRLRIRAKLALLVMIPLLAVGALTVPVVLERVGLAARAGDAAVSVRVASQVGSLAQDLQRERLLAAGFLVGAVDRNRLVLQMSAVSDRITDVRFDLGGDLPAEVSDAIDAVKTLADLRVAVLGGSASTTRVTTDYGTVINRLIGSLRLVDGVDAATDEGRQVVALDALLRADEATGAGATHLVLLAAKPSAEVAAQFTTQQAVLAGEVARFTTMATVTQISLYQLVAEAFTQRLGAGFTADPAQRITAFDVAALFPSLESFIALGNFVEKRIVTDVTSAVGARERRALTAAYGVAGGAIAVLLLVVLLVVSVARAVALPLRRLTVSADRVARLAEEELVRVADDETEAAERVHLDPVDVRARDEIGELARAFERVQDTAARLVERQVASRRNVAEMFGHIGRRTQGLVGRQVGLIDRLEQDESDPAKLADLYRLDHLSNRLLRNASSLVVLSGADWAQEHTSPLPLADAARLALAKVEDYTRIDLRIPVDILLTPAIIADLVQVMAELMENATAFSPPHTRVAVEAVESSAGVRLVVTDHGIGLLPERIVEENARLERRERLDLAPTQVLGLFVVGRLARRHGLGVALSATAGGGVTASVLLPARVLISTAPVGDPSAGGGLRFVGRHGRATPVEVRLPHGDALQQLRSILEDGTPSWNAFAISDRPAVAELPAAPVPAAAAQNGLRPIPVEPGWFGETAALHAVAAGTAESAGRFEVRPDGAALHRRSPGATLATSQAPERADAPVTAFDQLTPDEVRDLVEQFEFGVSRAMQHAETGHQNEERQPQ